MLFNDHSSFSFASGAGSSSLLSVDRSIAQVLPDFMTAQRICFCGENRVISCGYWDNSIKVHALDSFDTSNNANNINNNTNPLKEIASVNNAHAGVITCMCVGGYQSAHVVVTGSADTTVCVWVCEWPSFASACAAPESSAHSRAHQPQQQPSPSDVGTGINTSISSGSLTSSPSETSSSTTTTTTTTTNNNGSSSNNNSSSGGGGGSILTCVHILRGHVSPITCLHYCPELDLILSGDSSGCVCVHTARQGKFVRKFAHSSAAAAGSGGVSQVCISPAGYLVTYSKTDSRLNVFWVNGQLLNSVVVEDDMVECMSMSSTGHVLVHGGRSGSVCFRRIWDLQTLRSMEVQGGITSLWFTEDHQFLLVGCHDGTFSIITDPNARWKVSDVTSLLSRLQRLEPTA